MEKVKCLNNALYRCKQINPKNIERCKYPNYDKSYKTFYNNGKPEVIGFYKNGKLHGTYTVYNIIGNVISYSNFNN